MKKTGVPAPAVSRFLHSEFAIRIFAIPWPRAMTTTISSPALPSQHVRYSCQQHRVLHRLADKGRRAHLECAHLVLGSGGAGEEERRPLHAVLARGLH